MDRVFMKTLAQMCKAFLKIYDETITLEKKIEQIQIDFPYEIEKRDKEICYLNSLLAKSIQQSAKPAKTFPGKVDTSTINQEPELPRLCEMCGKPVEKTTHRFCCTSCQIKFSHLQRGHNVSKQPTPKRRQVPAGNIQNQQPTEPAPEPTPEEKGPEPGK